MTQEIKEMVESVPAEVRWNIASQASTATAIALDAAIQEAVGPEKREEILTKIYAGHGAGVKQVIDALGLPTDNAESAAKAVTCANTVMFGTEMQLEITESSPKKVVAKATGCAFAVRMKEMGVKMDCFPVCTAYLQATYNAVNPDLKFTVVDNCINRGDAYCGEYLIEL